MISTQRNLPPQGISKQTKIQYLKKKTYFKRKLDIRDYALFSLPVVFREILRL